ncbi:hypothetical protein TTRE_0000317801 [Trichuris trichiura]|uniref:Uncharacterized protein n=1 Tax=Trichuris trichiura TaxID=36087 RepID=A0A077Z5H2_TRITR|nr:hypothetical protein TTRE_0000317801 [Trichuris trichiura]
MSCSNGPKQVTKDLISFDDEPLVPTDEMVQSTPEPISLVDAWLTQTPDLPLPSSDASKPPLPADQLSVEEMINLLRLISRFARRLSIDKIIATVDLLTGKRCTKALLIEALQALEAIESLTETNMLFLGGMRPHKYEEKDYLVNSVETYVRYPVSSFNSFPRSNGEKAIVTYDMELLWFSKPDDFVIRRSNVSSKELAYLKQVDSIFWFPARKSLKPDLPCLVLDRPGGTLRRAIFRSFCPYGQGLFYLVDLEKSVTTSCQHAFLIPERIFRCYVDVYRVRLAFVRPFYGNLWSKAVVKSVQKYLSRKAFQASFVRLEEEVMSVVLFDDKTALFNELLHVPLAVFDLSELMSCDNLEALELLLGDSFRPLKRLQTMYRKNPGFFGVFESRYEMELKTVLYDKHGQLKHNSALLVHCARYFHRCFARVFMDVSCQLNDELYCECIKSERRLVAMCECFVEEHVALDDDPNLCYLDENVELSNDESFYSQLSSLSVSTATSSNSLVT